jgi:hypothetical protein
VCASSRARSRSASSAIAKTASPKYGGDVVDIFARFSILFRRDFRNCHVVVGGESDSTQLLHAFVLCSRRRISSKRLCGSHCRSLLCARCVVLCAGSLSLRSCRRDAARHGDDCYEKFLLKMRFNVFDREARMTACVVDARSRPEVREREARVRSRWRRMRRLMCESM